MLQNKLFKNLKLRHKLWLLVATPALLMTLYATIFSFERSYELEDAKNVHHLTRVTGLLNIVHRLQFERGKAISFVANRDNDGLLDWLDAVKQSDTVILTLPQFILEMQQQGANEKLVNALNNIQKNTEGLSQIRAEVSDKEILNSKVVEISYSRMIKNIHMNIGSLMKLIPASDIYLLIEAMTNITELKEVAGLKRALGSVILKKGSATRNEINRLTEFDLRNKILGERFLKQAPVRYQEVYFGLGLDNLIETNFSQGGQLVPDVKLEGDAEQWFSVMSQRIDKFRQLESSISENLIRFAQDSQQQASLMLYFTIGLSLFILFGLFKLARLSSRKLAEGFTLLKGSTLQFIETGRLSSVKVESNDELGELVTTFNHLIEHLKNISQVVEAVAEGDFSQSVKEKSQDDRLSISLNHMVRTLRDSVDTLKLENWSKTGQSDLAIQINSDQRLSLLTSNAISFLAEYLNASVGAVYTLDNNECATLCATYAYSLNTNNKTHFEKGESLVGQSVIDRKTIIVENLPDGYMTISSGLGNTIPKNLIVSPLIYADKVLAVIELGTLNKLSRIELDFIDKVGSSLAIAIHAALSREKMAELLETTQAQAEELQAQQEELEQSNQELSEQTRQLTMSQEELNQQKQELISSNAELKTQSDELEVRNNEIEQRSHELAAASKYKSEFLANMSHELRTPLNSLLLLSQSLKENDENNLTQEQIEALRIIYSAGRDLLNLINDILDLSKVEAGKLTIENEQCNLAEVLDQINELFKPLAKEKKLDFRIEIDTRTPETIITDLGRLQQILKNLIANAIKFTDEGYVNVKVTEDADENILFQIKDSGIGIPIKLKSAVFEAFQQGDGATNRKYSGTGLGLTISKNLANLLGGDILLDTDLKTGSLFTLVLPKQIVAFDKTNSQDSSTNFAQLSNLKSDFHSNDQFDNKQHKLISSKDLIETAKPRSLKSLKQTILIVEDDSVFAGQLKNISKDNGFESILTSSLREAKIYLGKEIPCAIILDILLPDGNGKELVDWLQTDVNYKNIPIHIMSSLDKDDVDCDSVTSVLTKPISKEVIKNALNNIKKNLESEKSYDVLVIEDDIDTQKTIAILFAQKNVNIIQANSGQSGLLRLKSENVDCIILDLNLPDIDCYQLIDAIKTSSKNPEVTIIIYTASDLTQSEFKKLNQYTPHIIIKGTVSQERLLDEVTSFLKVIDDKKSAFTSEKQVNTPELSNDKELLKGKKILVVDDDMRNTFALSGLLKRYGMDVVMADNGELALDKLSENNDINLVLMDIMMPVMDGYETIRQIRAGVTGNQTIPIIALTAKAMSDDRDKCLSVGANDYLSKPVDSHQLISTIKICLNKPNHLQKSKV